MSISKRYMLILFSVITGLSACYQKTEQAAEIKEKSKRVAMQEVTTYTASLEKITQSIRLNGQIEYNPNQVVHYTSLVNGIITKTHFSLGDKVTKGQVLAELRSSELTDLNTQSKTLQSQLRVAHRKLSVAESMFADRVSSEKDLFEAQSEVDILKSEIEKIQANLSLYNASSEKGVFQIKAPVSGYVVENNISGGTQINGNDSNLFTISDLSEVWITTNVYAVDLPFVQKGMGAVIKSKAYPGETFDGVISEISQVFDPQERVLKARIRMPNKDLKLKPGLTIEALVRKNLSETAIAVPIAALIFHNDENYILIQKEDKSLEPRKVTIHVQDNDRVFFKKGIEPGEKIVVKNQLLLFSEALGSEK
jgi:cobalt-zinc-cadmium efflux system membrane fusion protein